MSDVASTVIFDLDQTLTRRDVTDGFIKWLLRRQPWRLVLVVLSVPVLLIFLSMRATRKWPVRYAVWVATFAQTPTRILELVEEHVARTLAAKPSVFFADGLAKLSWHLESGHRVVIATGCFEILARRLMDRAGFTQVEVVGSTVRHWLWGMVGEQVCVGHRKVQMLVARGFLHPWSTVYTDHESDMPMLALSLEKNLVNPRAKASLRIRQKLGCDLNVLSWN